MNIFANVLGRLQLEDFHHDPVVMGGVVMMGLGGLTAFALLTYFKKWKWLYKEWLTSLDHKKIGVMYIVVALLMLLRGAADAGMMRAQQALNTSGFLDSDHFQQIFSAHGTIMIFFVAMGLMFGLINLVLPQQLGARDVAFLLELAVFSDVENMDFLFCFFYRAWRDGSRARDR